MQSKNFWVKLLDDLEREKIRIEGIINDNYQNILHYSEGDIAQKMFMGEAIGIFVARMEYLEKLIEVCQELQAKEASIPDILSSNDIKKDLLFVEGAKLSEAV